MFDYREIKAKRAEEGVSNLMVRWLITKEMDAESFAMRHFDMAPKGFSLLHTHPWEHEVSILEGDGKVVSEKEEKEFKPGTVIFIPAGEQHQFRNKGTKVVKFLCLIPYPKR